MNKPANPIGKFRPIQREQLFPEKIHDTYMHRRKPAEPTVCPDCKAVFSEGRWHWGKVVAKAHEELCPACHRIRDRFPAGYVTLGGPFFAAHREEILQLARHEETREKADRPLVRIMNIEDADDGVLITTTDIHLARDIGDAAKHAYQGELEFHYNDDENLLRVHWKR
jgi:NMD protein affecting ribosome stability and mRNA decay